MNKRRTHSSVVLYVLWSLLSFGIAGAQTNADTLSAQTPQERKTLRLSVSSVQLNVDDFELTATAKTKIEGVYQGVDRLNLKFYAALDTTEKLLYEIITNENGIASYKGKFESSLASADTLINFSVKFEGSNEFEEAENSVSFKRASLILTPLTGDTTQAILIKAFQLASTQRQPIKDATVLLYVKRLFSNLKIGEGVTDGNGEVTIDLPKNIVKDKSGTITIFASIEDNDDYGNVTAAIQEPWGSPHPADVTQLPRTLWSPYPPFWMMATFAILMTLVWGHYLLIIIKLIRLKNK